MKKNEARTLFRVLSTMIALVSWVGLSITIYEYFYSKNNHTFSFAEFFTLFVFALSFTYISIFGYLPRILLQLLTLKFFQYSKRNYPDLKTVDGHDTANHEMKSDEK